MAKESSNEGKTNAAKAKPIVINDINQAMIEVEVVGLSPLLTHRFSEKAIRIMEEAQGEKGGKTKKKREKRDPEDDFLRSMYWKGGVPNKPKNELLKMVRTHTFQIPARAFKAACVNAVRMVTGLTMKEARSLLFILGTEESNGALVDMESDPPIMDTEPVRIGGMTKTTDLRYRGEFHNWSAKLRVQYDADLVDPQTIVNLINRAGFSVGILEDRPLPSGGGTGGIRGRFRVKTDGVIPITDPAAA